ncbi:GntP family permease [Novosphingobium profundi]|uniref:GntP family permease n=1 Tax=Novosphingobium profundi TaxID=1774954 RepID=UPI001CFF43C4|nr:GntP family permease [Novosphingobium profundi]
MFSAVGLVAALALLILLTVRGVHILLAAPACAAVVAATSGLAFLPPLADAGEGDFATSYMAGFTGFFADWFWMFLLGAIFGEVMAASGAAASVARGVVARIGLRHAVLAVVAAAALLTYGGVSVFIVGFAVYPLAVHLFREADLPRRFIPAALAFGSVTFTMTSAGSPEIQNLIPMQYLGTDAYAAWPVSLLVAGLMAGLGYLLLDRMMRRALARGERFEVRKGDSALDDHPHLPPPLLCLVPLLAVLGVFMLFQYPQGVPGLAWALPQQSLGKWALVVALGAGSLLALGVGYRARAAMPGAFARGASGAVVAITNTCAVVGFGSVAALSPAFQMALEALQGLPGDPLIGAAVAVTVIAALTGSASGGQTIALPLLAPGYLEAGADPAQLHRTVAIASGALDSLPHNGYVVTTIRAICGETHKAAYPALGVLTVLVPLLGLALAIGIFVVI